MPEEEAPDVSAGGADDPQEAGALMRHKVYNVQYIGTLNVWNVACECHWQRSGYSTLMECMDAFSEHCVEKVVLEPSNG